VVEQRVTKEKAPVSTRATQAHGTVGARAVTARVSLAETTCPAKYRRKGGDRSAHPVERQPGRSQDFAGWQIMLDR
jgi:hypothetical protein